jgi:hypothetical protein
MVDLKENVKKVNSIGQPKLPFPTQNFSDNEYE